MASNNISLRGVGVALITPFTATGEVDYPALGRLIEHVTNGGVDYLVVLGTTGETATLDAQEKNEIIRYVIEKNAGKLPVVVGIGGNDTRSLIRSVTSADLTGVEAILSVTPYYNKPDQRGIYAHYSALLDESPLPVILYNVPGRTGINMTAETTLRLAHDFPGKALAVKEASGSLSQAAYILRDRPEGFYFISGDDNFTLASIAMGGDGVISVSANSFASTFSKMVHAALAGDFGAAARLNLNLYEATDLLFAEGNPVGVKAALHIQGIIENQLRLPLVSSSAGLYEKLAAQIKKYGL